jgi:hypothetical protein
LLTSAGVKGHTFNATTATIVTVSMADASSKSSATLAVAATTSATTRMISPSARTRASSPDAYTTSMPITHTMSATLVHATKCTNNNNNLQTVTKQKKHSHHDTCTTSNARNDHWTSSEASCLAEPVTPSSVTKEQAQAKAQQKIPFC